MNKEVFVRIDRKTLEEIQSFLARETEDPDMEADEVLHRFHVDFGNNTTADLEVCNGEPPYCCGQLYQDDREVCVLATEDESFLGPWVFEGSDGLRYVAIVVEK